MKTKFTATDSKGQVFTRGSQNRTYTHCVVAEYDFGQVEASWAGSPELAASRARSFENLMGIKGQPLRLRDGSTVTAQSEIVRVEILTAVTA